jgi:hypothetical protein
LTVTVMDQEDGDRPYDRQLRPSADWLECSYPHYPSDFILDRIPEVIRPQVRQPADSGTLEENVKLTITPAAGVPRLTDLLPVVRLGKND